MIDIETKRVYEPALSSDGLRVLVDRVRPMGITKAEVKADLWIKELVPRPALRKWFGNDPGKWEAFKRLYSEELDAKQDAVAQLLNNADRGRLKLLFSARDTARNQAVALKEYLLLQSREGSRQPQR